MAEAEEFSATLGESSGAYATYLARDSRTYDVSPPATVQSMSRAFPYQVDRRRRELWPGKGALELLGLRLRVSARSIPGAPKRQMLLHIENLRDQHLAYNIETRPTKGTKPCHAKRDRSHNAIAIEPGGTEVRSECIYHEGWGLEIQQVEIMEVPELAYVYLSRLPAMQVARQPRTARGHQPPGGVAGCSLGLPANIRRALESGEMGWRDLMDFYARHRCQTYQIPGGYRAFQSDGERSLPVVDESY